MKTFILIPLSSLNISKSGQRILLITTGMDPILNPCSIPMRIRTGGDMAGFIRLTLLAIGKSLYQTTDSPSLLFPRAAGIFNCPNKS